jgi:ferric-dicitrate binding protein FerR (iron transport regulator)
MNEEPRTNPRTEAPATSAHEGGAARPSHDAAEATTSGQREPTRRSRLVKMALGVLLGGGLGYAYWVFVGCNTGACPITSSPMTSTAYGAVLGLVATSW